MDILKEILEGIAKYKNFKNLFQINLIHNVSVTYQDLNIEKNDYYLSQNIFEFNKDQIKDTYDIIFGLLPMGLKKTVTLDEYKIPINYDIILSSLNKLNNNGIGLYVVEPSFFWSLNGNIVRNIINNKGYSINYCLQLPKNLLFESTIKPYLIGINREKRDTIFIADISKECNVQKMIQNFCNFNNTKNIYEGMVVPFNSFKSIDNEEIEKQKNIILQKYENINFFKFKEIIKSIKILKDSSELNNSENYILITKQGKVPKYIESKNYNNIYKIDLDEKFLDREYLYILLKSDLGETLIKSIQRGITIPYISKKDLTDLSLPIPDLSKQKEIIDVQQNLESLKKKIYEIENEFSLSVNSSDYIKEKIQNTISQLSNASVTDKILYCIRNGESQIIEFKQTFTMNIKTEQKDWKIELSALKTIAGFLNTNGGTLLIGIDDEQEIFGINKELKILFKNNIDKYLLFVKDKIKEMIGVEFFQYVNYEIVKIQNKSILIFEVEKSKIPCWYDNQEFYIRVNPATEKIFGKELVNYLFHRFKDYTL